MSVRYLLQQTPSIIEQRCLYNICFNRLPALLNKDVCVIFGVVWALQLKKKNDACVASFDVTQPQNKIF